MRFSAAIQPQLPLRPAAAADFIRRLVSSQVAQSQPDPAPLAREALPLELDQRVRLVGEW